MRLTDWMKQLGWTITDLSREAKINPRSAKKAVDGEPVSARVARDIAEAVSRASGEKLTVGEIEELNVQ